MYWALSYVSQNYSLYIYIYVAIGKKNRRYFHQSIVSLFFFPYRNIYRALLLRIDHCKRNNQIYIYTCTHIHIYSINKIKRYVEGIFFALFLWRTQCSGHGLLCTGVDREPTTVKESKRHKLIQQSLMLSSEYHTHPVKTKKGKLQCARWKKNVLRLKKRSRKENETKYD